MYRAKTQGRRKPLISGSAILYISSTLQNKIRSLQNVAVKREVCSCTPCTSTSFSPEKCFICLDIKCNRLFPLKMLQNNSQKTFPPGKKGTQGFQSSMLVGILWNPLLSFCFNTVQYSSNITAMALYLQTGSK